MLLKAHKEVMTLDRPIKHLSRQYLKVHAHTGDGDSKFVYLKNTWTALQQRAMTRETELELEELQFMINEVLETAYAVKTPVKTTGKAARV